MDILHWPAQYISHKHQARVMMIGWSHGARTTNMAPMPWMRAVYLAYHQGNGKKCSSAESYWLLQNKSIQKYVSGNFFRYCRRQFARSAKLLLQACDTKQVALLVRGFPSLASLPLRLAWRQVESYILGMHLGVSCTLPVHKGSFAQRRLRLDDIIPHLGGSFGSTPGH